MSSLSPMAPPPAPLPHALVVVHGTTELLQPQQHRPATTTATTTQVVESSGTSRISESMSGIRSAPRAAAAVKISTKQQRHRQKVKEFNDVISCYLCGGYLINATTIDYCVHSYCRACIILYLEKDKQCPKCKPHGKLITTENLRPDEKLKSLVFKLIPGLYQQERERQVQFYCKNSASTAKPEDTDDIGALDLEDDYFSPAEPISLSLEYHPALLNGCDGIPPVKYLQCPAAVTVHHLKRFLCSKYDIDPENPKVDIAVIYEEEILPENFSLMDVGYCYNWKRTAPMKFYYRIYVHSVCNNINTETKDAIGGVLSESKSDNNNSVLEAKPRSRKSSEPGTQKIVRFKDLHDAKASEGGGGGASVKGNERTYTVFKSKTSSSHHSRGVENDELAAGYNNNNNNNDMKNEEGPMKVVIARKPSFTVAPTPTPVKGGSISPRRNMSADSSSSPPTTTNDFKSLRSNDIRYSDFAVSSTDGSKSQKSEGQSKVVVVVDKPKLVAPCDIVVSIPQSQVQRASRSSADSFENLSLAELKTAKGKKHVDEVVVALERPQDLPKLKITVPKRPSLETTHKESKKSSKSRKMSIEEPPPVVDKVDLATYAKNIGLKPIYPKTSPDASPMSTSSSSASSGSSTFLFPHQETHSSSSSSHKKRKKAKHSKESKESKRRKIHAEISSQTVDESLKLKVKITGSHKSYKTDSRKSSPPTPTSPSTPLVRPALCSPPTFNGNSSDATTAIKTSDAQKSAAPKPFAIETNGTSSSSAKHHHHHSKSAEKPASSSSSKPKSMIQMLPNKPTIISNILKHIAPKSVTKLQEIKMPASPPLPPSLFKTTPLTLQTITTTSTKPTTSAKPALASSQTTTTNRTPKPIVPKMSGLSKFLVPSVPKASNNSPKGNPMATIASAANRQASQLKRSASLDCAPESKQQKLEQARKSAYGPSAQRSTKSSSTPPAVVVTSVPAKFSGDKPYYTSTMGPSYTREITTRKPMPMLLPPASISVTKMSDAPPKTAMAATAATPPKAPSPKLSASAKLASASKPALEIVRISSNIPPVDLQPITTTHASAPSATKSSPPKTTRPLPSTIPLVKIKRSMNQSLAMKPSVAAAATAAKHTGPPALISMKNIIPAIVASKSAATSAENAPKVPDASDANGRSDSSDSSIEVLDLSNPTTPAKTPEVAVVTAAAAPEMGSLEAALNKLKQSIPSAHGCGSAISYTSPTPSSARVTPSDDLQNLHLLSESATSREKIAIKSQRILPMLPKLNEICKVRVGNASVRQQNASVRHIPNPSALVSRQLQALPSPPKSPESSANGTLEASSVMDAKSQFGTTNDTSTLKKNLNLEQLAANLNMRAAAAADASGASNSVSTPHAGATTLSSDTVTSTVAASSGPATLTTSIVKQAPTTSFKSISSLVAPASSSPVSASIA